MLIYIHLGDMAFCPNQHPLLPIVTSSWTVLARSMSETGLIPSLFLERRHQPMHSHLRGRETLLLLNFFYEVFLLQPNPF